MNLMTKAQGRQGWREKSRGTALKVTLARLGRGIWQVAAGTGRTDSIPQGATFLFSLSKLAGSKRQLQGWGSNEKGSLFLPQSELLAHQTLEMLTENGFSCFIAYLWESM